MDVGWLCTVRGLEKGVKGTGGGRGTGEEKEKEGGIQDKRELGSKEG